MKEKPILVTGATGYVGGRLVQRLLAAGYRVRAVGRSAEKLRGRPWADHENVKLVQADLLVPESLATAVQGCSAAYYLIHSMTPETQDFEAEDRRAAENFVYAANQAKLERIIYLGGLGEASPRLSPHLNSRAEVGRILWTGFLNTTIFRSAHILGSGSASFEMLRYAAERLPLILVPPQIIKTKIQPICIRNVLNYLAACLDKPETIDRVFDIGGPDVLTYKELFQIYAEEAGLRRPIFITRRIPYTSLGSRLGMSLLRRVLPLPQTISGPLLEGVVNDVVMSENRIAEIIPQDLMTCREAIARAIQKESQRIVETRWTDAGELNPPEWVFLGDAPYAGGTLLQGGFKAEIKAEPDEIWPIISRMGGKNGWYFGDALWQVRGWMDSFVGGVGLRRGRRHPEQLLVGDALDFWRVLEVAPPRRLILVAEMKLPGEAILDVELVPLENRGTELRFNTRFKPRGLYGSMYWYALLPFHDLLFGGMLREIAKKVGCQIVSGPAKFKPEPISQRFV